jgi:hypothetical protein
MGRAHRQAAIHSAAQTAIVSNSRHPAPVSAGKCGGQVSGNATCRELTALSPLNKSDWGGMDNSSFLRQIKAMRISDKERAIEWPLALLLLIFVLAPFLCYGWAYWRDGSLARGFDEIAVDTSQQVVVRLMGKPKKVLKCGEFFGPIP